MIMIVPFKVFLIFLIPLNYPHIPLQELEVGDSPVSALTKTVPLVQQRGYNDIEFGSVCMQDDLFYLPTKGKHNRYNYFFLYRG